MRVLPVLLPLVSLLATSGCFGSAAYLQDPAPVYVAPQVPQTVTRQAVLEALDGRTWHFEGENGNQIQALLVVRSHSARVLITHGVQGIYIQYLDSTNLRYSVDRNGTARIHGNYNKWTERLARVIERNLQNAGTAAYQTYGAQPQTGGYPPVIVIPQQ